MTYKTHDQRVIEFCDNYGYTTLPTYDYQDFEKLRRMHLDDMTQEQLLKYAGIHCIEHGAGYQEMAYVYKIDEQELHEYIALMHMRNRWLDKLDQASMGYT